jgi:SAM-dependent methyltransferase
VRDMARVLRPGGVLLIEHEKAPAYWAMGDELRAFFREAVVWPAKRWTRFVHPASYWRRIRPLLAWRRWFDRRWMPEGDIHIWPEDHLEWDRIEAALGDAGCEVVVRDDHLAYEPRFERTTWERYRTRVADTRSFVARRVA